MRRQMVQLLVRTDQVISILPALDLSMEICRNESQVLDFKKSSRLVRFDLATFAVSGELGPEYCRQACMAAHHSHNAIPARVTRLGCAG
jgi:hypothetical protein